MIPSAQYRPRAVAGRPPEWWRKNIKALYFLCKVVLRTVWEDKFHDLGELHRSLCNFLDPYVTPGRRKMISVFRGSYKTTVLLAYVVWNMIRSIEENRPVSICYNTSTKDNAEIFMDDFQQILKDCDILRQVYPWWPKADVAYRRKTKTKVEFGHFKFYVASLDVRQVSRHFTICINDDLVNDDNAFSEVERAKVLRKWRLQKSILTKYSKTGVGTEIDVGTPYHSQDLMAHIIKNVKGYAKFIVPYKMKAADGSEYLTFPEVFTWEDFDEIREDQGASIFATQYELNVIDDVDRIAYEGMLRYFKFAPEVYNRYLIVDPAGTENKRNDPSAFVVIDVDPGGILYLHYAQHHWLKPVAMQTFAEDLARTYKVDEVYYERDKYTMSIKDTVEHSGSNFQISFVEAGGRPKPKRIHKLKQYFETGRIMVAQGMRDFEDQLLTYPDCRHDDILDALAYALDIIDAPNKKYAQDRDRDEPVDEFAEEMRGAFAKIREAREGYNQDAFF
jgi:predicted phage terminase large subunit-like protein